MLATHRREKFGEAKAAGVPVVEDAPAAEASGIRLTEAIAEYLDEVKAHKSLKTYFSYSLMLRLFAESCKKRHLAQIERKDIIALIGRLKAKGNAPRTVANRIVYLKTFLTHFGVVCPLNKNDTPRYTEKVVSAYTKDEIGQLMAAADREEYELFQFFLCTGARDQEVQFATWRDVNFAERTFKISEKLDLGFTPKDKEEGTIPIPDSLVALLQERKRRCTNSRLIFPGPNGKVDGRYLRLIKALAFRARMNCGHCYNRWGKCCADHPVCDRWQLHRFRKTFATWHHENGVPVRTIQRWLRHSDLETTLRYRAGSDDKSVQTRERVNGTFALPCPERPASAA